MGKRYEAQARVEGLIGGLGSRLNKENGLQKRILSLNRTGGKRRRGK